MGTEIVTMVTQLGFPIVAFLLLFYQHEKSLKDFTGTLSKMETLLDEVSDFIRAMDGKKKNES